MHKCFTYEIEVKDGGNDVSELVSSLIEEICAISMNPCITGLFKTFTPPGEKERKILGPNR